MQNSTGVKMEASQKQFIFNDCNKGGITKQKEKVVQKRYLEKAKLLAKSMQTLNSQPEISYELKDIIPKIQTEIEKEIRMNFYVII